LADLNCLRINHQGPGESFRPILGCLRTSPPVTSYAIEDGQVTFEEGNLVVSFTASIRGTVYTFTGILEGESIPHGTITPPPPSPTGEDGTWTAQAQGGGTVVD
jgi:hypothetical protein